MWKPSHSLALKMTAALGSLAVALGAFGAHGLEDFLITHGRADTWNTAVFYHLIHSVVLLVLVTRVNWIPAPWLVVTLGIIIFSGSLYLLCLTQITWLGAITPIGGILLIAGWLSMIRLKN